MLLTGADLYDEIENLNRAADDKATLYADEIERDLLVPTEDLATFFDLIPGKQILDMGCGWGRYVSHFVNRGLIYTGADYSYETVMLAKQRNPNEIFVQMSFHHLGFTDNSFDGIWGCCIFGGEPKQQIHVALAELRRVLKPNGIMYLILNDAWISKEGMEDEGAWFGCPTYHSLWDFNEFGNVLLAADFKIILSKRTPHYCSMMFAVTKE